MGKQFSRFKLHVSRMGIVTEVTENICLPDGYTIGFISAEPATRYNFYFASFSEKEFK